MSPLDHLLEAIKIAGSQKNLADEIDVSFKTVSSWVQKESVPEDHGANIERAVGGKVLAENLCPQVPWSRVPDPSWPNKKGRPTIDHAMKKAA